MTNHPNRSVNKRISERAKLALAGWSDYSIHMKFRDAWWFRDEAAKSLLAVIRGRVGLAQSSTGYVGFVGSDHVRGIIDTEAKRARSYRQIEKQLER
jgi:hypothetical protein